MSEFTKCAGCGMPTKTVREYHPWAVCSLFRATHNSDIVRDNIKAVVEYGMKAERCGVSLDDAMADFNTVIRALNAEPQNVNNTEPPTSEPKDKL